MSKIDGATATIQTFASTVGSISTFISGTITKYINIGNVFFIIIIFLILWGLYKIWAQEMKNKAYFRSRRREI